MDAFFSLLNQPSQNKIPLDLKSDERKNSRAQLKILYVEPQTTTTIEQAQNPDWKSESIERAYRSPYREALPFTPAPVL